jgi:hypothetical protein
VKAPCSDKNLTTVLSVDPIIIGGSKLNLGAGGAKELLSNGLAEGVCRDAHDPDKNPKSERGRNRPG